MIKSALYCGNVVHHRIRPKKHHLSYHVYSFFLDLDELGQLAKSLRFFSHNRFNLFSFYDKDHGASDGRPLSNQIRALLKNHGCDIGQGKVMLLSYPRLLGYAFNPLSVYYCYDEDQTLKVLIYEVNNTFSERQSYIIPVQSSQQSAPIIYQDCEKGLFVSPFTKSTGHYQFRVMPPAAKCSVGVTLHEDQLAVLRTHFQGARRTLKDSALIGLFFRYPFMTLKVITAIHYEALRLWYKKIPLQDRHTAQPYTTTFIEKK